MRGIILENLNVIGSCCVARSFVHQTYHIHSRVEVCLSVCASAYKSWTHVPRSRYMYIESMPQHSIKTGRISPERS